MTDSLRKLVLCNTTNESSNKFRGGSIEPYRAPGSPRPSSSPRSEGSSSPRSLRRHSVIEDMVDDDLDGLTMKHGTYVKVFLKSVKGIKSSNSASYFDTEKGMPLNTFRKDACIKIRRVRFFISFFVLSRL